MTEKSILLIKYEKIKRYSSNLFDNEEWAEFNAFCDGYNLDKLEPSKMFSLEDLKIAIEIAQTTDEAMNYPSVEKVITSILQPI